MSNAKTSEDEVTQFMAAVVMKCCKFIEEKKMDAFDVSFEHNEIKYRLSLLKDSENAYLKEN